MALSRVDRPATRHSSTSAQAACGDLPRTLAHTGLTSEEAPQHHTAWWVFCLGGRAWGTHAVDIPDVHYARAGGVAIAYQVVGDGPQTLIFSPQVSDLFTIWLGKEARSFLDRLAGDVRVVLLNPRGTGLSDRPRNVTLEARMDDIAAVFDHLGLSRASLLGISMSANVCALFAASYPERVEHLILAHPFPRAIPTEDYPWGFSEDDWLSWVRDTREHWGERAFMEDFARQIAPGIADDPEELDVFVWMSRLALSPTAAADWTRLGMETDIVDILSSIRVPTLVLHPPGATEATHGVGPATFVAERIRGSRTVALLTDQSSALS
jgi:pimeloyl-ACP methyl ester carboxylesterase